MKKTVSLLAAAMVLLSSVPALAAGDGYTVRDAYMDFAAENPEYVQKVLDCGFENAVSESMVLGFLNALQRNFYYDNIREPVSEANFDGLFFDNIKSVLNANRFAPLQAALTKAYPDAVDAATHRRIHPDILPMFETVKNMILGHKMAEWYKAGEDTTVTLREIEAPGPLTVEQLAPVELPDSALCLSESGLWVRTPLIWDEQPDTAYAGSAVVTGRLDLSRGNKLAAGLSAKTELSLIVTPLPSQSGKCGPGLEWVFENGVLTVSGTGEMTSYTDPDGAPWAAFRDGINRLVVEEGVASVGDWAFAGLEKLASRSVSLPDTVLTVGEGAFAGAGLDSVRLPSGLQSVGQNAFDGNPVLYGGPADGAACGYARENELDFVADGSRAAGIISLRQLPSGEIEIDSVNTGAKLLLAVYGPGMELLELIPAADGKARPTVAGAKYAKAFCWERTGLVPLCRAGSLRLSA